MFSLNRRRLLIIIAVLAFAALLIFIFSAKKEKNKGNDNENREITVLVENFGGRLKNVSLLAPSEDLKKSIEDNYKGFLTDKLLNEYLNEPRKAPGRLVSSPWPEGIEIESIERINDSEYLVKGIIIEKTSEEEEHGGFAAKRPITLKVIKTAGKWLIDDIAIGKYENRSINRHS
jgi:hypothetical protein